MAVVQGMEVYSTRLESFGTAKANGKKGHAKSAKSSNWPLAQPTADQLAQAGFYFDPTSTSPDNVTCFLCLKSVDGWESEDDPVKEHAHFSPDCGIAIHALIEQNVEAGIREHEDPTSERMLEARKATFGDMWPHEKKRGWTCKTQKMVEAGWHYCPTADSDDFVKCAYCGLSLDGWEPKDKPFDEHQRRSAECSFFLAERPPKAKAKAKKSRASKASRVSTQSTATLLEDATMNDIANADDSIMTAATDKAKKAPKTKKGKAKAKTSAAPMVTSSFIEPEDDDFEVKVAPPTEKPTRGRKRKSDEIDEDSQDVEAPPRKVRGPRMRSSTVKPETAVPDSAAPAGDVVMYEADDVVAVPVSKKGRKAGRTRESSTVRKASAQSTASVASLRADGVNDAEIDAALEADLDKPEAEETVVLPVKQPAKRGRAASKAQKSKASVAPTRQPVENSLANGSVIETTNGEISMVTADESMQSIAPIKNPKQRAPRATNKRTASKPVVDIHVDEDADVVPSQETNAAPQAAEDQIVQEDEPPKVTRAKGRQPSRKASRQVSRAKPKKVEAVQVPADEETVEASKAPVNLVTIETITKTMEEEELPAKPKRGRKAGTTKSKKSKVSTAADEINEESTIKLSEDATSEATVVKDTNGVPKPAVEAHMESTGAESSNQLPEVIRSGTRISDHIQTHAEEDPSTTATPSKPTTTASQQIPSPTPSPQHSDAENQPPSSRPSATRPPLAPVSPTTAHGRVRIDSTLYTMEAGTPTAQRTALQAGLQNKLSSTYPWTAVNIDSVFEAGKENAPVTPDLTSPEKRMTVEQWVRWSAAQAHERLRAECERVVGRFESEGVKALKTLEGIPVVDE